MVPSKHDAMEPRHGATPWSHAMGLIHGRFSGAGYTEEQINAVCRALVSPPLRQLPCSVAYCTCCSTLEQDAMVS